MITHFASSFLFPFHSCDELLMVVLSSCWRNRFVWKMMEWRWNNHNNYYNGDELTQCWICWKRMLLLVWKCVCFNQPENENEWAKWKWRDRERVSESGMVTGLRSSCWEERRLKKKEKKVIRKRGGGENLKQQDFQSKKVKGKVRLWMSLCDGEKVSCTGKDDVNRKMIYWMMDSDKESEKKKKKFNTNSYLNWNPFDSLSLFKSVTHESDE